ncbi:hypothetical protein [Raineyella antarctica]|uniref:hypothetical protein n=1 Tax=Raineyella antarctica TaxID=1577474 RepID=UPI00158813BD|nr:hypothetical protein [Raineyella antarctica]
MVEANGLVRTVFSGLAALVIEDVEDAGDVIVVRASTRGEAVKPELVQVAGFSGLKWC